MPDNRIDYLSPVCAAAKITYAQVTLSDLPGLVSEPPSGRSYSSRFLPGIPHTYDSLDLISLLMVGKDEVRAWTMKKGTLRLEGRDYGVQDGDVVEFRFNVRQELEEW
ncbi:MAG: hypothetical protein WBK72_05235 [Bacillota bacterium]